MNLEVKKLYSDKWFSYLQAQICNQFEEIEKNAKSSKKFISTNWFKKINGGGGTYKILRNAYNQFIKKIGDLMAFKLANISGKAALVKGEHYYDLKVISNNTFDEDTLNALNRLDELHELNGTLDEKTPTGLLEEAKIDAPISSPKNCYAVGLNYRNHAEEAGMEIPSVPMIFTKHTSCLVGPHAEIEMRSDHVDYEAELVAVIGKSGKDISVDDAWDHVAGLCIGQDISDRVVQFAAKPPQFNLGKSFDTFGPMGPYLVSLDALENKEKLNIKCKVNDEIRQNDNTNDLIFDIPSIIKYLSEIVTLNVGDVIFTGTPGGVGVMEGKFLKEGDVLTTSIEGLGSLENVCKRITNHSGVE